jgi:outer membrane cobalamin receptor
MSFSRLGRLAAACRLALLTVLVVVSGSADGHAADAVVRGVVVDQSGRAVPRAYVRVLDPVGTASAAVFADESGRFQLTAANASDCRVEATLTGFQPAIVPCAAAGAGRPLTVVLAIAPIRETMIVTATRTEAPTSQVGASATIFTAEDLERRQTPLVADLLAGTPGAMVVRSGGPGALTSLFVRGGESDYNKVLLDGVPLNEPGGSFYLSNLTTENLERVEIVRGAYSSLFGSDAMASVIQLFTRRGDRRSRRPRVSAQVDGGTYGTLHATAGVSGATERFDYSLATAQYNSDNRVPNSRLENTTLSANLGVAIGGTATLRFIGRGELEHVGTPGTTAFGRPDLDAFFDRRDRVGSVTFDQQVSSRVRQRASYSLAASRQQSTNLTLDPPYTATFEGRVASWQSSDFLNDSLTDLRRHHASYQADLRLTADPARGDQLLTVLADWDGERATVDNRLAGSQTVNARDNVGVSAQQQMLWRRLFVTLGARLEHNASFGTAAVPRATVVYVAHQPSAGFGETRLKASAGTAVKEPTMLESFSASPFFRGNPDLKPERSRSAELGIEQRVANDRVKLELTYFDNRFRDIISLVTTNPSTFEAQFSNIGLTRARGIEAGVEAAPIAAVRVRAGYTLLDSKILESASPSDTLFGLGRPAFRRPRHSGFAGVTLTWKRAAADLNGVFVGSFADSDFGLFNPPLVENPGHTTWDARLMLKLTAQLTGTLSIDNLTDRDYSEPFGYQPLRRTIRAGLRVGF